MEVTDSVSLPLMSNLAIDLSAPPSSAPPYREKFSAKKNAQTSSSAAKHYSYSGG
ncbi:hypothetical protein PROFUN_11650 [Planoprotostelium fungivorum]|uniref:Uncharacterized protein n=1 Tax=Planoprotostelium fungivorum TaxID=1890364 RepID=A0A2P6N9Q9_9EUKA|nr:hypothetical protein PROFUN_11650 [Planoprotostelium fungivorum]